MAGLPNVDRLKQLPLRALVAYAVRCAMRVQMLYLKFQDGRAQEGPPAGMAESVAEAIELACRFAADEGEYDVDRGQELEEIVIEAVMRAKNGHRGAAFAANAAYAALNAANLAHASDAKGAARRTEAEKVVQAVTTAADAAAAAHEPVIESAVDDWHALQLMRIGEFPDLGDPLNPRPEGKLGPLFNKKPKEQVAAAPAPSWRDESPTLRQIKKSENVLEQTRQELIIQQEERKKDKAAHEAKCDEYEKRIRDLKAEIIPLKRERDNFKKLLEIREAELKDVKSRLTEFANQFIAISQVEMESLPETQSANEEDAEIPEEATAS